MKLSFGPLTRDTLEHKLDDSVHFRMEIPRNKLFASIRHCKLWRKVVCLYFDNEEENNRVNIKVILFIIMYIKYLSQKE